MCDWVTLLSSRKLTKNCKPARMEKIEIIKKILDWLEGEGFESRALSPSSDSPLPGEGRGLERELSVAGGEPALLLHKETPITTLDTGAQGCF